MKKIITTYRLECIKEKAAKYELESKQVRHPSDLSNILEEVFGMSRQAEEVFAMLVLNTKHMVVGAFEVSRGSLNSSMVHPREVFKRALLINGAAIALGHNHPSGVADPSPEDVKITQRLIEAGKILGIEVLDHVIVVDGGYKSLKEECLI